MDISLNFTPEDRLKAKNSLIEKNLTFALSLFSNLADDCIEKNLLEFNALREQAEYCKECKGTQECKDNGHHLVGTMLPNGQLHLSMSECRRRMPIPGTVVRQKKSGYYGGNE